MPHPVYKVICQTKPKPLKPKDKVCLLKRPLYGLKQGRCWYEKLDTYLKGIGMMNSDVDPCVYVSTNENCRVITIVYVDDLLISIQKYSRVA